MNRIYQIITMPPSPTAPWHRALLAPALAALPWTAFCAPAIDGALPELPAVTVRADGGFTIDAELGRKGRFFYGLEMGPCRADEALCGGGDPQLIGLYNKGGKALVLRTT